MNTKTEPSSRTARVWVDDLEREAVAVRSLVATERDWLDTVAAAVGQVSDEGPQRDLLAELLALSLRRSLAAAFSN